MSDKLKEVIGYVGIAVVVIITFAVLSFANTYSNSIDPSMRRNFSVSAEGKVVAVPDVAAFSFSVITEGGTDIGKLQTENSAKVNGAISYIKSLGVEDKDIKTQNYSIYPQYQYYNCNTPVMLEKSIISPDGAVSSPGIAPRPCPPAEIVGYTVNQSVSVKLRDFEKIGTALSGVVEKGVNSVSQISFTIDDPDAYQSAARAEAVVKAKAKAYALAKAGGFSIGRLLSIQEGGYAPQPLYYAAATGGARDEAAIAPQIEAGSQDITTNITLTYEIQ